MIRNDKVLAVFTMFLLSRYVHTTTAKQQKKKEQKDNKKHTNKVKTQHLTNIYDYVNKSFS